MKAKYRTKYRSAITLALFLVLVNTMVMAVPVKAADASHMLKIDIMAKGPDFDVPGAISFIKGTIEYNKDTGELQAQVEFQLKLYDESGKKIYSMKGELKDAAVMPGFEFHCDVRDVTWINLWFVIGEGQIKTTDIDMEIEFRGNTIPLPNTGGKYVTMGFGMLVSPDGEYFVMSNGDKIYGVWDEGGWAFAGLLEYFGAGTYLTKYMVKMVP